MSAWPEWKRDNCTVTVSCCDMKKKELRAHARYHLWLQSRTATWWGLVTIVDVKDKNWETNKRMKSKFWSTFSKLFLNESMKDEKKLEKNIFQDLRGPVTVPNEDKVSYWLRRRRRENASEKTFFVPRPQRPLRFRTIPPLLFPALYALPAFLGGFLIYLTKITVCIFLKSGVGAGLAFLSTRQINGTTMSTSAFASNPHLQNLSSDLFSFSEISSCEIWN